ncbi:MAG: ATP-binding protein [Acidobacteriia bacterium]|nr:ATP-binding protein [Terriglobia bacterium]
MNLVAITVKNYRSITKAHKLQLGSSTVLIGRNNEGKSNILRALVAGLRFLRQGRSIGAPGSGKIAYLIPHFERESIYNWENDYPIALREAHPDGGSEFILEFELDKTELKAFQKKVGSNLNGNLPIKITFGREEFSVAIAKQGPAAAGLTKKAPLIAEFVRSRLDFEYIPAVRTAQRAHEVVDSMLSAALRPLESDPRYKAALKTIADLQKPVLAEMSQSIKSTLVQFLPAIRNVQVRIATAERTRALRTASEIVIDDGTATPLKHKGDGVQSLAAIALMRHAAGVKSGAKYNVIALEEPESHLHPSAIHELKAVLQELAKTQQIVITTHCPLFVDRTCVSANIIVDSNKARSAESITEIREILGVRAADNLRHAELVLIVEGGEDVTALQALLGANSPAVATALQQGALVINALDGATNLSYKASLLRDALCEYHCYLDNDDAGQQSFEEARNDGLLTDAQCNFTICNGMPQGAEIEDIYDTAVYRAQVEEAYNVTLQAPTFHSNRKWSERMRDTFLGQGKQWTDRVKGEVKALVGAAVAAAPATALNQHKRGSFDGLVRALEQRLAALHR